MKAREITLQNEVLVIQVKPYNQKELAHIYGVCSKTFKKWIADHQEKIGPKKGRYFMIPQVMVIFKILCLPSYIKVEDINGKSDNPNLAA